jgi:ABC-type Zn uptake system ZnuABC Zn-binding protein ZnuA
VTTLGTAKILFTIGVPFEQAFLPTIESTLKSLKIIDTSVGIEKRHLEAP